MVKQRALSLVDKLKQNEVQERIKSLFIKKDQVGPWVVELDPTTACNLACHDCISANLLNQGGIDPSRLLKLADEFKEVGVRAVVLIGGGEPMAHKEFGNLVDAFSKKDIHTGVTTNGTLMKKHMQVCAENVSWLRVSVDAGSENVFQEFRPHASGKSQFNLVIDNMREFAKKKKGILLEPLTWCKVTFKTKNAVMMVFCDREYEFNDYIEVYSDFKKIITKKL